MKSSVLFDLGNVIFKINFDHCFKSWAKASGRSFAEIKAGFVVDESYRAHERGEITGREYYLHLCKILKFDISFDDFLEGWNSLFEAPIKPSIDFLERAAGKQNLYALTNSNALHRAKWSELYFQELKFFNQVFCSSQIHHRKPEAAAFNYVLSQIGVAPTQLIFVDDLAENIAGAKSLGINAILFDDPLAAIGKVDHLLTDWKNK